MLSRWAVVLLTLCHGAELVKVQIDSGWLDGELVSLSFGPGQYYSFKGIPYAEPPVGAMRFKDPLPHKGWKGVRKAKKHGQRCVQFHGTLRLTLGHEDCLFANVYTPSLTPKEPLPVIVYIHESGWTVGSGNSFELGPDFLVYQGVLLVTFNYRLDMLGYLNLGTKEVPGNAGMKDCVLLLRWVRKNIRQFGGDPDNVTIMGESSGGMSVIYLMMSPMGKGLFKRAICMSGVPMAKSIHLELGIKQRSYTLGKVLGSTSVAQDKLLEHLQSLPVRKFVNTDVPLTSHEMLRVGIYMLNPLFVPGKEDDFGQERFLEDTPMELLKRGYMHDVDLLIGYTNHEHVIVVLPLVLFKQVELYDQFPELMVPREILMKIPMEEVVPLGNAIKQKYFGDKPVSKDTIEQLLKQLDDHSFIYNTHRFLKHMPERDSNTFLYKFETVSKRNVFGRFGYKYGIYGAAHTDDLTYLFDALLLRPVKVDSREFRLINQTCGLWANFAKNGNPTSNFDVSWPPYDNETRACMHINDTLRLEHDTDADIYQWWHQLFVQYGVELP